LVEQQNPGDRDALTLHLNGPSLRELTSLRRAIDQGSELRSLLKGIIEDELEPRRVPQPQPPPNFAAQEGPRTRETLANLLGRVLGHKRREVDPCGTEIRIDLHFCDGDAADARVLPLARDELRERTLQLPLDPPMAGFGFGHRKPRSIAG